MPSADHGRQRRPLRVPDPVAGIESSPPPSASSPCCEPVEIRKDDKWARIDPYDVSAFSFKIDFNHPCSAPPVLRLRRFLDHSYLKEIARARTFVSCGHRDAARSQPGAGRQHGQRRVLTTTRVLNATDCARDEFVKHKVLDAIGDLYLLGMD